METQPIALPPTPPKRDGWISGLFGALSPYWKLAVLRCSVYALIVGWSTFRAGVEGYDNFGQMTGMQIAKLIGDILFGMLGVWLAFIDQTQAKLKPDDRAHDGGGSSTTEPMIGSAHR